MTLTEKITKIFESGNSIKFQNVTKRKDSHWYNRIIWTHVQSPTSSIIKECDWFGFDNIEDCVDDCLTYLNL